MMLAAQGRNWLLLFTLLFVVVGGSMLSSCKKEVFLNSGGYLRFSTDTLTFDTVFTAQGSVTRSFKVYNPNKQRIKISSIALRGGDSSRFRMNIDGTPCKKITDVELAPDDSLYIFVATTINPTAGNSPFLVSDAVDVQFNQKAYDIPLEAYGQDAHYISDSVLKSQTWINDKPYVIIHSALVDSGEVLTIQKGCRIYMHADSKLYVSGSLKAFGTKKDSIIFQGDRLDRDYFGYKDYPSEWCGIHFLRSSTQNVMNFTVIKNAGNTNFDNFYPAAVIVSPPWVVSSQPVLEMNQCIIANSGGYGILGFNTQVRLRNCLIHTCGLQNIGFFEGGNYEVTNCTLCTYGGIGINHANQPTVAILNYRDVSLTEYVGNDLTCTFTNNIVYGPLSNEFFVAKKTDWAYNLSVDHCLLKRTDAMVITPTNTILNVDPQFTDLSKWNYRPKSTSPAKGAGIALPAILNDLDDLPRGNPPSMGCYEVN
jgi:hypothetical protein